MIGEMLSLGGNLLNNYFAGNRQEDAQDFSAQQFATRYQTTVNDMKAAGLNPMLAYGQGGGNAPTSSAASAPGGADLGMVHLQSKMNAAQVANIAADTENKKAQAAQIEAETARAWASAGQSNASVGQIQASTDKLKAELGNVPLEGERLKKAANLLYEQANLASQQQLSETQRYEQLRASVAKLRSETKLLDLDVSAAESLENLGRTSKELKPVVDIIRGLIRK